MNTPLLYIFIIFIIFIQNINANIKTIQKIENQKILIGYYGRPNTKSLGILGESNIDTLVKKMKIKEEYFKKELNNKVDIQMAFHIIYGLATPDPGKRNTYMLRLSEKSLLKYIKRAKEEGFKVIIDLQMGTNSAVEALSLVLKYLKYDNVHLALDPEFRIPKHRRYPPGRFIGHIFAKELNTAQELVNNYIIENDLEKKDLIVHMFHKRMLRKKDEVKNYENVNLVYNIDGHGDPAVKIKIYNNLYTKNEMKFAKSGFKIFYNADTYIMTPKQLFGLEPTRGRQIWTNPYYINYQ